MERSDETVGGGGTAGAEPIAIVGFGGVFPGARTLDEFWRIIERGTDVSRPVPPGRWVLDPRAITDPAPGTPDRVLTDRGCFIEGFQLDPTGLDLPAEMLRDLDPSVHLLLEAGRNAFVTAQMKTVDRGRIGVVMGNIVLPTEKASQRCVQVLEGKAESRKPKAETNPEVEFRTAAPAPRFPLHAHSEPDSSFHSNPAAHLSRVLHLGGPSFSLDAACASSLYALKLACDELRAGRTDAMLAGGLSRPDSLYTQMGFSQLRALAPSGRCAPFDAASCGLIVGEGAGVVVLKRLADALRDGDTIHALIRGIGLSSDLEGNLLSPSSEGQLRALRAAYAQAGWTPDQVDYLECHATGTPVGDAVEFASLCALVGQASSPPSPPCVLGAVKANIGHLLTAAGSASLIKLLLALRHQTLPPIANFKQASAKIPLAGSPFRILQTSQPWPRRDPSTPRRAAINGFGFGGINAHVLIEEWLTPAGSREPASVSNLPDICPVAIVGLAGHVGACVSLHALQQAIFCDPALLARPSAELANRLNRFRIPPRELGELLPQQALMLEVARAALADAAIAKAASERAAVFIGLGLDARTTDYHHRWASLAQGRTPLGPPLTADRTLGALAGTNGSRIAKEFHFGGPAFTVSAGENSGVKALELAVRALQHGETDQALAGAVDFSADPRVSVPATPPAEGAVAFVLKRLADAQRDGDRIYAVVRDLGLARQPASASGFQPRNPGSPAECATQNAAGSPPVAPAPHAGHATGLLSVLQGALALYHETIPGKPPRSWLRNRADGPRRAPIRTFAADGTVSETLLEAIETQTNRRAHSERAVSPVPLGETLFVLAAAQLPGLLARLEALRHQAVGAPSLTVAALARHGWQTHPASSAPWSVALIAQDTPQLLRLLDHAQRSLHGSASLINDGLPPEDRDRVFHSPPTQRVQGGIAFVFPGAGNTFPDMGRELALHWPQILRAQDRENERLASQMCVDRFWSNPAREDPRVIAASRQSVANPTGPTDVPRSAETPPRDASTDHRAVICGQVALGTLVSDLAISFGLKPDAVIGYSLGEATGLFALRAWTARDEMLERVTRSTLFSDDLTGKPEQLRRAWGLPAEAQVQWQAGLVDRSAGEVRAAIASRPRLYVLIVNTPRECVVGGDAEEVRALVTRLGCHWWPLDGVSTVHCELLRPFEQAYRELHLFPTDEPEGVRFFSGGWGREFSPNRETAAEAIVAQASDTVDFPRVIEAAYAAGVRFFLEMGPGNSCSRMIGQILEGRPHVARSLCVSAREAGLDVLRVLGQLVAEGVAVKLDSLYGRPESITEEAATVNRCVRIPIRSPLLRAAEASAFEANETNTPDIVGADVRRLTLTGPPSLLTSAPTVTAENSDAFEAEFIQSLTGAQAATLSAHEAYLKFSQGAGAALAQSVDAQLAIISARARSGSGTGILPVRAEQAGDSSSSDSHRQDACVTNCNPALDRAACLEFARGQVAKVLGPAFADVDTHPTRVRLPDEPLMLVDRILEIEGEPRSMSHGRVVTEHDILSGAWYLDCGRIPTCIAVESGQADLFLSGYLGIDFQTRGRAVYRLLDAKVCFHRNLPGPGEVIRYDIHIDNFFQQGGTWLFRFHFEATVNGEPLLSMKEGCAGFFSAEELAGGRGIVHTAMDLRPLPGKCGLDYDELVPFADRGAGAPPALVTQAPRPQSGAASEALVGTKAAGVAAPLSEAQLEALRAGDLAACFGAAFTGLPLRKPITLPSGRMKLVHRITHLDPNGGRFGLGLVRGEADIRPDDWFLTCHFVDDRVMPGTLMYECCLHTLRAFLLRLGWVAEEGSVALEPVPGVVGQLKCRGQVLECTKTVTYEVTVKEIGYRPEPYVIADALMYADGKPIVEITNMSLRYTGLTREHLRATWAAKRLPADSETSADVRETLTGLASVAVSESVGKPPLYGPERILAFAIGKPSEAFGDAYRVFDQQRRIARLPGPPYQFLDRITEVTGEPFKLVAGGVAVAEYDVPPDAWYFTENRQGDMPFAVLLEVALQPCGWLAAYCGSALSSDTDLSFRNLGGKGTQFTPVLPATGALSTRVSLTKVSSSAGMIIQWFDLEVRARGGLVYQGDTYFGFFPQSALAKQEGIRDAQLYQITAAELAAQRTLTYPSEAPFPGPQLRMVDDIMSYLPQGGSHGLGFIRATKAVQPEEWFFKAHFYQDPVVPGSLGLESLLQLLKFLAIQRWGHSEKTHWEAVAMGVPHEWTYRGQVVPNDRLVTVEAVVTAVDDVEHLLTADGFLSVDGRVIYGMKQFTVRERRTQP
jgi:acyl transferase domain-containing protein/3-hydroxymyristoyl/3-hydroxydecanoyl-(acyl carrier protein) dehydratase